MSSQRRKQRASARTSAINRRRDWKTPFLARLAETGNVKLAATAAGVSRQAAYKHRDADESFAEKWDEAMEDAADVLEAEAWRRAVEGVVKPVVQKGQVVNAPVDKDGNVVTDDSPEKVGLAPLMLREYSDALLMFKLKGHRPEKYRESHHHVHDGSLGLRTVAEGTAEADALLSELRQRFGVDGGPTPAH